MLALSDLSLSLGGQKIIRDLSFSVNDGDLVCLLGPSGCGKTTTLRIIAGFERPDSGTLEINGQTVSDNRQILPPHKRDIGYLFQDFALFPHLTVRENIGFGLKNRKGKAALSRIEEILEQVRLTEHADKYPHMLSGGQQQRVALGRALAPNPKLLLLDEPFSGLDTSLRDQIRDETLFILKKLGVTTLMVTHDPEEAMLLADQIVLMRDGEVVQTGSPEELYLNPTDAFTVEFFGDTNKLKGKVKDGLVQTHLGRVGTGKDIPDGTEVNVLVRPEGLKLKNADLQNMNASEPVHVCGIQYLGRSSLVQLGVGKRGTPHEIYKARLPGHFVASDAHSLDIDIDPKQAFVFS
ncbi:MAG: ABC transporter ATP-binding protein [Sneathiellales bacterium]|nr:ABC transporter ATP-binding protein [Sneathiellales bacterium]